MAVRTRAFTLLEVLIAAALAAVLLGALLQLWVSGLHWTRRSVMLASLQNQGVTSVQWVLADLGRTNLGALAFLPAGAPGQASGLGMVRQTGQTTDRGLLLWEEQMVGYFWYPSTGLLERRCCPPAPPALSASFSPSAPPSLGQADLRAVADGSPLQRRKLADHVVVFQAQRSGNLIELDLELKSDDPPGQFELHRKTFVRNG